MSADLKRVLVVSYRAALCSGEDGRLADDGLMQFAPVAVGQPLIMNTRRLADAPVCLLRLATRSLWKAGVLQSGRRAYDPAVSVGAFTTGCRTTAVSGRSLHMAI